MVILLSIAIICVDNANMAWFAITVILKKLEEMRLFPLVKYYQSTYDKHIDTLNSN